MSKKFLSGIPGQQKNKYEKLNTSTKNKAQSYKGYMKRQRDKAVKLVNSINFYIITM